MACILIDELILQVHHNEARWGSWLQRRIGRRVHSGWFNDWNFGVSPLRGTNAAGESGILKLARLIGHGNHQVCDKLNLTDSTCPGGLRYMIARQAKSCSFPHMEAVLKLLLEGERLSTRQMGEILNMEPASVQASLEAMEADETLLGWRPVINPAVSEGETVQAIIEVRIRPEREGGFDRLAYRISRFESVESCYLVSGAYDLLLITKGNNLHQVARFVSEKLATMDGVLSTATHFLLRAYKEQGYQIVKGEGDPDKPAVSP